MRALVTGAGGFVGQWLCRALLREGWTIDGVTLEGAPTSGILSATERAAVTWHALDISEPMRPALGEIVISEPLESAPRTPVEIAVARLFEQRLDAVFHLSGIAFQAAAAADEERAWAVNVGGAKLVHRALRRARALYASDPTMLIVGSGEQYGAHEAHDLPLVESAICRPLTLYGRTKQYQETLLLGRAQRRGDRVIAVRSFNHSGPGQSPQFFLPGLAARVRAAKGGEVPIGNTDVIRDFLHVEDVVSAYISLVTRGTPGGVYNVCSGDGVRIGDLAAEVIALAGTKATLKVDPALQRPVDVPALVGSNAKLRAATGWVPTKSRSDMIADILSSLDAAS